MKILRCEIENFGKLEHLKLDFTEHFQAIIQENGWGKSTFAAFIKAMFYGLGGDKKRDLIENERKHYKPWQGGAFGGSICFEAKGKRYVLTRFFGDKEAGDTFELRDMDTNLVSEDYSVNIGEELFQIDRESFLRTVYVGQNDIHTRATDGINAKIGNFLQGGNDMDSYEKASASLKDLQNSLTPNRATGSLNKRNSEITRLKMLVADNASLEESMRTNNERMEQEQKLLNEKKILRKATSEELEKVTSLQKTLAKRDEWMHLKEDEDGRRIAVEQLQEFFPGDIVPMSEIGENLRMAGELKSLQKTVQINALKEEEKEALGQYALLFVKGVPDEEFLNKHLEDARNLLIQKQECAAVRLSPDEKDRLFVLEEEFSGDTESVETMMELWNDRNSCKAGIGAKEAKLAAKQEAAKKGHLVMAVGAVVILAGAIMAILGLLLPGILIAVLGVLLVILGKTRDKAVYKEERELLRTEITEDCAFLESAERNMSAFLLAHGFGYEEQEVFRSLQRLMERQTEWRSLSKKRDNAENNTKQMEVKAHEMELRRFLQQYGIEAQEQDFVSEIHTLQNKKNRFDSLLEKQKDYEETVKSLEGYRGEIQDFLRGYGFEPRVDLEEQLQELRDKIFDWNQKAELLQEATKRRLAFEETTDVTLLQADAEGQQLHSLEELQQKLSEIDDDIDAIKDNLDIYRSNGEGYREKYEDFEENRLKLSEMLLLQEQEKQKFEYVKKAAAFLSEAKEALTAKYCAPMMRSFSEYYALLTGREADQYQMDANTNVTVKEQGIQREIAALSTGYQDLTGICLRMAMVDAMYSGEPPVLIMDDPFVNLDDEKLAVVGDFLRKASEKYQIIYFTCSQTRM